VLVYCFSVAKITNGTRASADDARHGSRPHEEERRRRAGTSPPGRHPGHGPVVAGGRHRLLSVTIPGAGGPHGEQQRRGTLLVDGDPDQPRPVAVM
jgi:hypothetical protein